MKLKLFSLFTLAVSSFAIQMAHAAPATTQPTTRPTKKPVRLEKIVWNCFCGNDNVAVELLLDGSNPNGIDCTDSAGTLHTYRACKKEGITIQIINVPAVSQQLVAPKSSESDQDFDDYEMRD